MLCAISERVPDVPVVSKKSGILFDKRLIEKHITTTGKCPVTGEELSVDDLVEVKLSKVVAPRQTTGASIPGMLEMFQNEWDALITETFTLKQHLESVRQELSHSLYQHDAACRVIARLTKERDEARKELESLAVKANYDTPPAGAAAKTLPAANATASAAPAAAASAGAKNASNGHNPIQTMTDLMMARSEELTSMRKMRKQSENLATEDGLKSYKPQVLPNHHDKNNSAMTSLDLCQNTNIVLTGGADGKAVLFDISHSKVVASIDAHKKKKVTDVSFVDSMSFVTASADKTVKFWRNSSNNSNINNYSEQCSFTSHKDVVTGVCANPTTRYLLSCSLDSHWCVHDVQTATTVLKHAEPQLESVKLNRIRCHPDGVLMGVAAGDGTVAVFDLNSQSLIKSLSGHDGPASALCFSENGFHLASCGVSDSNLKIWDLRKMELLQTIQMADNSVASSVEFDTSGKYLLVSGRETNLYTRKGWAHLGAYPSKNDETIVGTKFGEDAKFFITAGSKGGCNVWK